MSAAQLAEVEIRVALQRIHNMVVADITAPLARIHSVNAKAVGAIAERARAYLDRQAAALDAIVSRADLASAVAAYTDRIREYRDLAPIADWDKSAVRLCNAGDKYLRRLEELKSLIRLVKSHPDDAARRARKMPKWPAERTVYDYAL